MKWIVPCHIAIRLFIFYMKWLLDIYSKKKSYSTINTLPSSPVHPCNFLKKEYYSSKGAINWEKIPSTFFCFTEFAEQRTIEELGRHTYGRTDTRTGELVPSVSLAMGEIVELNRSCQSWNFVATQFGIRQVWRHGNIRLEGNCRTFHQTKVSRKSTV